MGNSGEKRPIPGTRPEWGRYLPDDDYNSLVDANGNPYDNGVNYDERKDEDELEDEDTGWDGLAGKPGEK